MDILLIEDDPTTSHSVELMLKRANIGVAHADLGEEGLGLALAHHYDLILLDLGLPDMEGLDVLRTLRAANVDTPILVLTGSDDDEVMMESFDIGATDYLPKPFHAEGLLACVQTIARRSAGQARSVIRTGPIEVNLKGRAASVNGRPVTLTGREYQMLELLSRRKGTTLTKEMFLDHLYQGGAEPDQKIIDVLICKLRKKLARATGGESHIYTVWGRGYVLQDPGEVTEAA
jgi:two-component system cell cycle response regulator CtrA